MKEDMQEENKRAMDQDKNHKKEKTKKPGKGRFSGKKAALFILQQVCLLAAAYCILIVVTGTFVWKNAEGVNQVYRIDMNDTQAQSYEDSIFFNEILGSYTSDILRYGVICGQMETNGAFNGRKEIDVTAYVNRYSGIPSEYITAKYYLEDLIKWSQYGFERNTGEMSGKEADEFLSKMRTVTSIDFSSGSYTGGKVSIFNSDLESITRVEDVSGNVWNSADSVRDDVMADILTNQYLSVEGKNIEDYVFSWDEYYELCANVESAANDLSKNYMAYLKMQEEFQYSNTNVVYCIKKTIGDNTEYYSNIMQSPGRNEEVTTYFEENYGKYIFFDPSDMKYDTNTLIEEETIRHLLKNYSYAYPDNVQIWIGVDTTYPANDLLAQGNETFANFVPYYWQLIIAAVFCLLLYFILFGVLTALTGVDKGADGSKIFVLRKGDRLPTEILLAGIAVFVWGISLAVLVLTRITWLQFSHDAFIPLCMAGVLICGVILSVLYYSLVRRIKAKSLWQDSLIRKGGYQIRNLTYYIYDHATVLLRVWLPFILYMVIMIVILVFRNPHMARINLLVFVIFNLMIGNLLYFASKSRDDIIKGIKKIKSGDLDHKVSEKNLHGDNLVLAQAVNSIGDGIREAVANSMKDERMKTDLITNVSHDIKTPLTSIINYVELIKRENIDNDKIKEYIEILDSKSQRLKQLTDDLVEASKISSGNISLNFEKIDLVELVNQTIGEFSEKFEQKGLQPILRMEQSSMIIEADSRRIWRVIENLFNNIWKYALEGTRIYLDIYEAVSETGNKQVIFAMKNISAQPLNMDSNDLTERFIRGDVARTTEGSGLGLSIAKSLTEAQKGKFEIMLDGDLFKVMLTFPLL